MLERVRADTPAGVEGWPLIEVETLPRGRQKRVESMKMDLAIRR